MIDPSMIVTFVEPVKYVLAVGDVKTNVRFTFELIVTAESVPVNRAAARRVFFIANE